MPISHCIVLLLALLPLAGCGSFGRVEIRNPTPLSIENFQRYLVNKAVAAHYCGDSSAAASARALLFEIKGGRESAAAMSENLHKAEGAYRFVPYSAQPGVPMPRELSGTTWRAIAYPLWGLPFDVADSSLKAYAAIPVVGTATAYAPMVAGQALLEISDDESLKPHEQNEAAVAGAVLSVAPIVTYYTFNGLQAIVYPSDWDQRLQDWEDCGLWWTDPDRRQPGELGATLFPNWRRIVVLDPQVEALRREIRRFRRTPMEAHNERITRLNSALDNLPGTASNEVFRQLIAAEEVIEYRLPKFSRGADAKRKSNPFSDFKLLRP